MAVNRLRASAALLLFMLVAAAPVAPATAPKKDPIPSVEAQKQATKVIEEVYRTDLSRGVRPGERVAFSKRLLQDAIDTANDPPGRWVLATSARDLAEDAGAVEQTFSAIDFLESAFVLDASGMRNDALNKLVRTIHSTDDAKVLYRRANALLDAELIADHYDKAVKYADLALSAARRTGDSGSIYLAGTRLRETKNALAAFAEVKEAQAKLTTQPNDPVANTAVGRFRCFVKWDWQAGLPLLAHGADNGLKTLATDELFADPADLVKVADGWWDQADKQPDVSRQLRWHAAELYKQNVAQLTGLNKAKVQERITEAGTPPQSLIAPKPPPPPKPEPASDSS